MSDPFLPQSVQFGWQTGQTVPITAQCETLNMEWGRSGLDDLTGPDFFGPFSFSVYTSVHNVPLLLPVGNRGSANITIPFPPSTMYQICMYDGRGNTGGCQDVYTVYPSTTPNATCPDFPAPEQLNVVASRSRFASVAQCDKIALTFTDGQAPYQFSVLPAHNTPLNVSGITGTSYEWQNILGRPASFFLMVADAGGRTWSQGPMYSARGPTDCLDYNNKGKLAFSNIGVVVGAAVGVFVAGALLATLVIMFYRWKFGKPPNRNVVVPPDMFVTEPQPPTGPSADTSPVVARHPQRPRIAGDSRFLEDYDAGAYTSTSGTGDELQMAEAARNSGTIPQGRTSTTDIVSTVSSSRPDTTRGGSRVYVVHGGDGGRSPPVTIYSDSTRVVELPPSYDPTRSPPAAVTSHPSDVKSAAAATGGPSRSSASPRGLERRPEVTTPVSSVVNGSESGPSYESSRPLVGEGSTPTRRALPSLPPGAYNSPPEKRAWGSM